MSLVHYNPWRKIDNLEHRLHHLHPEHRFNSLFDNLISTESNDVNRFTQITTAELTETDSTFNLKLEIPGMKAEDLDIQVTQEAVSISGERKEGTKTEEKGHTRSEFYYGKFQRVVSLPVRIQNTNVTAKYENGVLSLTLPKMIEDKNKVVKISLEN